MSCRLAQRIDELERNEGDSRGDVERKLMNAEKILRDERDKLALTEKRLEKVRRRGLKRRREKRLQMRADEKEVQECVKKIHAELAEERESVKQWEKRSK